MGWECLQLDVQSHAVWVDPLLVGYPRLTLPCIRSLVACDCRCHLGLCGTSCGPTPLHGRLPSPGVLLVLVMARLVRPHRLVTAHWHCF